MTARPRGRFEELRRLILHVPRGFGAPSLGEGKVTQIQLHFDPLLWVAAAGRLGTMPEA